MPYDSTKDPYNNLAENRTTFGKKSRLVVPSDDTDLDPYVKGVSCATSGNLSVVPMENEDGDTVDYVDIAAGFSPPFQVRRVMADGTTATVYTIED